MKLNPRQYYEKLLDDMPPGLDRAVLSILRFHIGLAEAIEKEPLILTLENGGFHLKDERQVRIAIVKLRKAGVPVCSSSAESGYFLPATHQEFTAFVAREYWKKIKDMTETALSMTRPISKIFPSAVVTETPTLPDYSDPDLVEIFLQDLQIPAKEPVQTSLF